MKKLAVLNSFSGLLVLAVALTFISGPAQAYVYDSFTGTEVNYSLWQDVGPDKGLFSLKESDDSDDVDLYFEATTGQFGILRSYEKVSGAFFVSMHYSNFAGACESSEPFTYTTVALVLQYVNEFNEFNEAVGIGECLDITGKFFSGRSNVGGTFTQLIVPKYTDVNSAWLGIGYDGNSQVTLWCDAGTGWEQIADPYTLIDSDIGSAPYFSIQGYNVFGTSGESLSFQVSEVQLTPLPPSLFLLGSGLLGLAGWRYRCGKV
jgi:hypothetical protein